MPIRRDEDYDSVPSRHMVEAVKNWVENGIPPGSFLSAVITNDLKEAAATADSINRHLLFEWVGWFWMRAPSDCWGSLENAQKWIQMHKEAREEANSEKSDDL